MANVGQLDAVDWVVEMSEDDVVIDLRAGTLSRRRGEDDDESPGPEHRLRVAFRSGRFRRRF